MYHIFVVSDGTGMTAKQALDAALTQFPDVQVNVRRVSEVRSERQIYEVIQAAVQVGGFIVHTLVREDMRESIVRMGRLHNVVTIDLMGPLLSRLSYQFQNAPSGQPGLFHKLNDEYFRRIETMEFAIRHDDGLRAEELHKAEIVLVGVSRTFKTPLSIYLAFKGWFVGNVPIVYGVKPPEVLSQLPPKRVFALTTNPRNLATLRNSRAVHLNHATGDYDTLEFAKLELMYARDIYDQHPEWSVVDVTRKPIEEIASEIIALLRHKIHLDDDPLHHRNED